MQRMLRAAGTALAAGGALSAAAAGAKAFVDTTEPSAGLTAVATAEAAGAVLMMLGLPVWYVVQAGRAGKLGVAGFLMTFVGWATLQLGTVPLYSFLAPALYARPGNEELAAPGGLDEVSTGFLVYVSVGLIALNLGILLFGIATIRARVFPRPLAWFVTLAPLAIFIPVVEAAAISLVLAGIGACGLLVAMDRVRTPGMPAEPAAVAG
ncbi:hypothetical protein [Dactylosporangium sp. NPDC051541]|uniref:hypothetical protein n=1 Tax=Dactylosporangium sp. NPDC051541 TaxID=3363977 RepID=UPI0037B4B1B3